MRIAYYESEKDNRPACVDVTWDDLAGMLADADEVPCWHDDRESAKRCPRKNGAAWSPVDIEGARANANVRSVTALVVDVDGVTPLELEGVRERLRPYRHVLHSTHSDLPESRSARVVVALSRPVPTRDWRQVWEGGLQKIGIPYDPQCGDPARLYFLPRLSRGREGFTSGGDGAPLDVDEILAAPADDAPPLPPITGTGAADIGRARDLLRHEAASLVRSSKTDQGKARAAVIYRVLDGEPFAVSGDYRGDTDLPRGRDGELNRFVSLAVSVLPPGTSFAVLALILEPSLRKMAAPEGLAHWLSEAEDMHRRAARRRTEWEDQVKSEREKTKRAFATYLSTKRAAPEPASTAEGTTEGTTEGDDWRDLLQRNKEGNVRANDYNVTTILTRDPSVAFRFNLLTKNIEPGGVFADVNANALVSVVSAWLNVNYQVEPNPTLVRGSIYAIARAGEYDPVRDFLESLSWDGAPRVRGWLRRYVGAETRNSSGEDVTRWIDAVGERWMIGLVARPLRPGCKMDNVLILEGPQGIGKSTVFSVLAAPWFSDDKVFIGDKDSRIAATGCWIHESGELASLRRAETETIKGFFSQSIDKFRPPYAPAQEAHPRRCVFAGTTNEKGAYLSDPTGNRRYWTVRCGTIDVAALRAAREQLLAEAVVMFRRGDPWWFDAEDSRELEDAVTQDRVEDDPQSTLASLIQAWWDMLSVKPEHVTMSTVLTSALRLDPAKFGRSVEVKVGHALKDLGFRRERVEVQGRRLYRYVKS